MNKEKLIEYYNKQIKIWKEKIELLNKKLFLLKTIVSNSKSMIEIINSDEFDE